MKVVIEYQGGKRYVGRLVDNGDYVLEHGSPIVFRAKSEKQVITLADIKLADIKMKQINENCWWHPKVKATHIVNLGTLLDRDTLACDKCAKIVGQSKSNGPSYNAVIRAI